MTRTTIIPRPKAKTRNGRLKTTLLTAGDEHCGCKGFMRCRVCDPELARAYADGQAAAAQAFGNVAELLRREHRTVRIGERLP